LYIKSGASAQKENNQERSQVAERVIHPIVSVGDQRMCPECRSIGSVIWVSQDKKTMGVQCHKSHLEAIRPVFQIWRKRDSFDQDTEKTPFT